ncbi:MAG: hypothetical protein JWO09_2904 [Bacteroidetes bacterium]|nr:hypothetical protein [Bacteroidota bacterium]
MKKSHLLTLSICIFLYNHLFSTERKDSISIIEIKSFMEIAVDSFQSNRLVIELTLKTPKDSSKVDAPIYLKITANKGLFDNKYLSLETTAIIISEDELKTNKVIKKIIYGSIRVDETYELNKNKLLSVSVEKFIPNSLVEIPVSSCLVKVQLLHKKKPSKDGVSFALGSNFDLADKTQLNSFYGSLSYFKPNVIHRERNNGPVYHLGIYGGIYQNKFITQKTTEIEKEHYQLLASYNNDSVQVKKSFTSKTTIISNNNYGLLISLPFTVYANVNSSSKQYISFTPIDFEALLRKETTSYEYTSSSKDTIFNTHRSSVPDTSLIQDVTIKNNFDKYWGTLTLQYSYSGSSFRVFMKSTPCGLYWRNNDGKTSLYYSFFFSITEKNFGLRIGGEFKGIYGNPEPYFNLFITKAFDFSAIGKAIKEVN